MVTRFCLPTTYSIWWYWAVCLFLVIVVSQVSTLNNTYNCAHINGLIFLINEFSYLIMIVRDHSQIFNKNKQHACQEITFILFQIKYEVKKFQHKILIYGKTKVHIFSVQYFRMYKT